MSCRAFTFLAMANVGLAILPVPTINATKYLGRWYQMYSDLTEIFIETKYCVQADCLCQRPLNPKADFGHFADGLNTNGSVSVWNRDRKASVSGDITEIFGYASQDKKVPAELTVYLQGVPVGAPYWIVGLGQPTYGRDGLYEWAIVSDPLELTLFVLARNVSMYNTLWNETVFELLDAEGFTSIINSPIPTIQDGCPILP